MKALKNLQETYKQLLYIANIKNRPTKCQMVRDRFVMGVRDQAVKQLQLITDLSLEKAMTIANSEYC